MKKILWKGRLRLFPTLRCNAACSFCNNTCPDKIDFSEYIEADVSHYRKFFKKVDTEQVIIGGGEPALHHHFNEIVELSCRTYKDTIVYTNGKRYGTDKIARLKSRPHICMSYHPTEISKEEFLDGFKRLTAKNFKFYWLSAFEDRYNPAQLVEGVDWLKENGIKNLNIVPNWYYEPVVDCVAGRKYKVKCYIPPEPPISPDLQVYACHSRMFARDTEYSWDIINDGPWPEYGICEKAGWCSMCDRNIRKERI